jgi:cell shape-determining protein MreC
MTTSILAIVLVFVVILNFWKPSLLAPLVHATGRPILEARGGFLGGLAGTWDFFHSKATLVAENKALHDKASLMTAVEVERDYYKDQNAMLGKLAGRIQENKEQTFAKIISKPGFSPYDTMIIDAGKKDGIAVGDRVLADDDSVLGEVSEVYSQTAIVSLYSSPDRETPVLIGSKSIQAVAVGKGGGNFEIKLPKNTEVAVSDIVTLASTTPKILGTIQVIHTSDTDSFERALFKSSVDISALSLVVIEKHQ